MNAHTPQKTYIVFGEEVPASMVRYCRDCAFYREPGRWSSLCDHSQFDAAVKKHWDYRVMPVNTRSAHQTCGQWEARERGA